MGKMCWGFTPVWLGFHDPSESWILNCFHKSPLVFRNAQSWSWRCSSLILKKQTPLLADHQKRWIEIYGRLYKCCKLVVVLVLVWRRQMWGYSISMWSWHCCKEYGEIVGAEGSVRLIGEAGGGGGSWVTGWCVVHTHGEYYGMCGLKTNVRGCVNVLGYSSVMDDV